MTYDEVVDAALARASSWGHEYPGTRMLLYRRVSYRERQLYSMAARADEDRFGTSSDQSLTAGSVDLSALRIEALHRVEVLDPGGSGYSAGDRVSIIKISDPEAALAPRATFRSGTLAGYGSELDSVTSVRIYYAEHPAAVTTGSGTTSIPEPHDELLVVDLTKHLAKKALDVDGDVREAQTQLLADEETELLQAFVSHVSGQASGLESRFLGTQYSTPPQG